MKATTETMRNAGSIARRNYERIVAGEGVMQCVGCKRTIDQNNVHDIEFASQADMWEAFISGTCQSCWDDMFPENEDFGEE